jgi:2-dehydropantoate 2-reductase
VIAAWHILGAGAMGQLLACKLLRAGISAKLICRNEESAAHLERGIQLQSGATQTLVAVEAGTLAHAENIAALFITTKAPQAHAAFLQAREKLATDAPVILMVNGMGLLEQLQDSSPDQKFYAATTTEGAYREAPARLVHAGQGETRIGAARGGPAPEWFAVFANSAESFHWDTNISRQLWRKLLINCVINPLTAIHRVRNGELLRNAVYREQAEQICAELALVCRARGEHELADQLRDRAFEVIRRTAKNQSSMLQDVLRERSTEVDFINGYLCREARRLGVNCPLNQQLWNQLS